MKLLAVIGSRDFEFSYLDVGDSHMKCSWEYIEEEFESGDYDGIVTGGASGPDSWAVNLGEDLGCTVVIHYPDWEQHGPAAGPKRNQLIMEDADGVLAFWDGESSGTENALDLARDQGLPIRTVNPDGTVEDHRPEASLEEF